MTRVDTAVRQFTLTNRDLTPARSRIASLTEPAQRAVELMVVVVASEAGDAASTTRRGEGRL